MGKNVDVTSGTAETLPQLRSLAAGPEFDVIQRIDGSKIQEKLIELASIGGEKLDPAYGLPDRYATARLALGAHDEEARGSFIKPLMEQSGMEVYEHPLADIGILKGSNPELEPIVILSHTDTVPRGDMYDGVTGVIAGIELVNAVNECGLTTNRNIMVVSVTGEESSRFNFALFGSRAIYQGLTDSELDASDKDGQTIGEVLGPDDAQIVKEPIFGRRGMKFPIPRAVVELHVEQFDSLVNDNIDVAIIDSIAAPVRHEIIIGQSPAKPEEIEPKNSRYFTLKVNGKADHSGATPMGKENRADGLVETATYLLDLEKKLKKIPGAGLNIGGIDLGEDQAMNKIPGDVTTHIRLSGANLQDVEMAIELLDEQIEIHSEDQSGGASKFDASHISISEVEKPSKISFFEESTIMPKILSSLKLVDTVNKVAEQRGDQNIVGTVGVYSITSDGKIKLCIDIRGKNLTQRNSAEYLIKQRALFIDPQERITFGDPLPGSGEPVEMDASLVRIAEQEISKYEISTKVMFSPAGHDSQNAARAGIPTVMLFCPSHNGAHNPDAYTTAEELEKGARALAATVLKLCQDE